MSISAALNNAVSGLNASTRRAEITSNNIANALTPGYTKKSVNLASKILDGAGAGVRIASVDRPYVGDITGARRITDGELADQTARSNALTRLSDLIGGPGETDSLFARYEQFQGNLQLLADNPESAALQLDVVLSAKDIASKFASVAENARQVRQNADDEIGSLVTRVNRNLEQIADLNTRIRTFGIGGRDASALEDQRELLLDEVASIVPVRTQYLDDGTATVMTKEGHILATTVPERIEFTSKPIITPDMVYADGTGILSGLTINGLDITPGGSAAQQVQGGALAGLFAVRDEMVPEFQAQIDAMAADLVDRFETGGLDATLAPGASGLFTDAGAVLDPLATEGLSSRLAVNAAVDPEAGGETWRLRDGLGATAPGPESNADLPFAMIDILSEARDASTIAGLGGDRTSLQAVAAYSELRATAQFAAEFNMAASSAMRETLANSEADAIGVNTDIELQELLLIEQAYAANAQVVRTASAMLDELRNLI